MPAPLDLLDAVVASLADPFADPDLTVGQAVWRVYQWGADHWQELQLAPEGAGLEAFDAIYRASPHGLHVLDALPHAPVRESAPGPWQVPVPFGGERVAIFTATPREGAGRERLGSLEHLAPTLGILLLSLAQQRRLRREIAHLRALSDLHASLWRRTDRRRLVEGATAGIRQTWGLERVRLFVRAEAGPWPLWAESSLPGAAAGRLPALPPELVALLGEAEGPVRLAPGAWLMAVADEGTALGALLLDNAVTGAPLERRRELVEVVRALAGAWVRAPAQEPLEGEPPPGEDRVTRLVEAAARAFRAQGGCLVVWLLTRPAPRSRRRDRVAVEAAARTLERLVPPPHRWLPLDHRAFAALLPGASLGAARDLAEEGTEVLASAWQTGGAVLPWRPQAPARPQVEQALALALQAASLYSGAVLTPEDRWRRTPEGGLELLPGAVLHPDAGRLDLAERSVRLTRTEVRILRALAHSPRPLSAGELVRRVWPGDPTMGVMNLYPHIHELRRRLTEVWPRGLEVRTVRGQGYVLAGGDGPPTEAG